MIAKELTDKYPNNIAYLNEFEEKQGAYNKFLDDKAKQLIYERGIDW